MRRLLTGTLVVGGLLLVVCLMAVNGQAKVVDEADQCDAGYYN
ncbi:hypothetical protein [Lactiplantibacillus plantarum]|nr:hypothetical protein [Lactiplantibacillus plantarum]MDG6764304.1 hypothetical protein [Lactiplantibacillus plantarum]MDH2714982.1 hypothetical protein [Lactiplantibacillus plantarum]MDH7466655.1 hypothetical protein [Lactiplantibacillus plantarum]MDN3214817.1 hypothetical protein [Lactiplantibacillus plantarum]MDN3217941.1 hypothetical protein [Lactiplantibacillus plantarum]